MKQTEIEDYKKPQKRQKGVEKTREEVISEVKRLDKISDRPVTSSVWRQKSAFSESVIYNHFDSIADARECAQVRQPENSRKVSDYKDKELIRDLVGYWRAFDKAPRARPQSGGEQRARNQVINASPRTYRRRFGSWTDALLKAGVPVDKSHVKKPPHQKYTVADLVQEILDLAEEHDRPPYKHEFEKEADVSSDLPEDIAGTWAEALRVAGLPPRYRGGLSSKPYGRRKDHYGQNWEEQRHAALVRDRWRCQDCGLEQQDHVEQYGRSLHMHHIRPIRSFETPEDANFIENLITLCEDCHDKWEPLTQRDFAEGSE
jgi:hypothetical protein